MRCLCDGGHAVKERVAQVYATQMRNVGGGRGAVVEFSGDEEGGENDEDVESVQMDGREVSSDQFFADEPHENYIENAMPLPPEGKGDPPPDTILSREPTVVRNRGEKLGVKQSQVKTKSLLSSMVGENVQSLWPVFFHFFSSCCSVSREENVSQFKKPRPVFLILLFQILFL